MLVRIVSISIFLVVIHFSISGYEIGTNIVLQQVHKICARNLIQQWYMRKVCNAIACILYYWIGKTRSLFESM